MAKKKVLKIAELANRRQPVDISEEEQFFVRGLTLTEMVQLLIDSRDTFLPLYGAGLDGIKSAEALAPFLLASPKLVARIIAFASDEPDSAETVEKYMPGTVQLIALYEVWKVSVPDAKKAKELLSEVTALLQRLMDEGEKAELLKKSSSSSPTTSPLPLNS